MTAGSAVAVEQLVVRPADNDAADAVGQAISWGYPSFAGPVRLR